MDKPDYSGMTVNERVNAAGLMDQYAQAARNRDGEEMIRILMCVALSEEQARWSTETVLKNPKKYGY